MSKAKRKITCYDCRKQTSNPYSRLVDGREVQICYQCSNKRVKMLIEQERLAAWNAMAFAGRAEINDPDAALDREIGEVQR